MSPIEHTPVVSTDSFLTLHYRLSCAGQDIVNTFGAQPATLSLGQGMLASALEAVLLGLPEGAQQTFQIAPGEAFGAHHAEKVQWVAGSLLDELDATGEQSYQVGDVVQFPGPSGSGEFAGAVIAVEQGRVLFDFNHPFAGKAVEFEVHILAVL